MRTADFVLIISMFGFNCFIGLWSVDQILNQEKYEVCKKNLPTSETEVVIAGSYYAGFGVYGLQDGDDIPSISSEEQIARTAEEMQGTIIKIS